MPENNTPLLQGTLDMLILKTVALEPMHAHGIGQRIDQISQGVFQVNPGSLFPAFKRLERAGWLDGEWRATENNRRAKYYVLTASGRNNLSPSHAFLKLSAVPALGGHHERLSQSHGRTERTCEGKQGRERTQ